MSVHKYTDKVMDHFRNPRNVGAIENPDGYGKVGNPVCGDLMEIFLKIGQNDEGEDIIDDIKFSICKEKLYLKRTLVTSSFVEWLKKVSSAFLGKRVSFEDLRFFESRKANSPIIVAYDSIGMILAPRVEDDEEFKDLEENTNKTPQKTKKK